ncbi:MAG: hypothetical protein SPL80_03125 [Bacilli bacterium]|nr:hypothetical protein [Bacilli bacterium]
MQIEIDASKENGAVGNGAKHGQATISFYFVIYFVIYFVTACLLSSGKVQQANEKRINKAIEAYGGYSPIVRND